MRLSTKTRYGTRAMIELARNYGTRVSPVNLIAKNQNISERYLQNILLILVDAGLVKSVRGKNGGFILSKEPALINLAEIVSVLEEDRHLVECMSDGKCCGRSQNCVMKGVWKKASENLYGFLDDITLAGLLQMGGANERGETVQEL
jgi:Rrf2 family protein